MTPALLVAVATWVLLPDTSRRRRRLWSAAGLRSRRPLRIDLIAAAMTPLLGLLVLGWPLGLVGGALAAPAVAASIGRLQTAASRRRDQQVRRQLPAGLDLVVAALEAGRSPDVALRLAADATPAPLGDDLAQVAHRVAAAADLASSLEGVGDALTPLTRALRRAGTSGVPVAVVVAAAAEDARREQRGARRELGRRVGVRTAAPLGLCFLPSFVLIGIVPAIIAAASTLRLT